MTTKGCLVPMSLGVALTLAACVGQLQFEPAPSGTGTGGASAPLSGVGVGGAVAGTGGSSQPSDAGTPDASLQASCPNGYDVLTSVFKNRCGTCHSAAAPTKNLDLVSAGLAARTVGVISTCNNKPLLSTTLTAGAPTGHLLDKLAGPVTGCGVQMPAGGTPLSSTEMACVKDWALQAIQNSTGGGSY
jgi:hypothetical protein